MKMSEKYPKYYKPVPKNVESLDVYAVCQMFPVDDPTGCINHARKKLLVPGTRTGGKSMIDDIREARDTLNRYLELIGYTEDKRDEDGRIIAKMQDNLITRSLNPNPRVFEAAPLIPTTYIP